MLLVHCYMFCKDTKNFSGMQVIMGVNLESCFMLLIFRDEFFMMHRRAILKVLLGKE